MGLWSISWTRRAVAKGRTYPRSDWQAGVRTLPSACIDAREHLSVRGVFGCEPNAGQPPSAMRSARCAPVSASSVAVASRQPHANLECASGRKRAVLESIYRVHVCERREQASSTPSPSDAQESFSLTGCAHHVPTVQYVIRYPVQYGTRPV